MRQHFDLKTSHIIIGLVLFILLFTSLYFIALSIFKILAWLSPALLIAALILDYKTVFNYGKWIFQLWQSNFLHGLVVTILTVLGYPLVAGFLFFRALLIFRIKQNNPRSKNQTASEYIEYEEVEEETFFEQPTREKDRQKKN